MLISDNVKIINKSFYDTNEPQYLYKFQIIFLYYNFIYFLALIPFSVFAINNVLKRNIKCAPKTKTQT